MKELELEAEGNGAVLGAAVGESKVEEASPGVAPQTSGVGRSSKERCGSGDGPRKNPRCCHEGQCHHLRVDQNQGRDDRHVEADG